MDSVNRRGFLKGAATVAAGAGAFNINRLGRTASDEIRIGVVGVNGRGKSHIGGFLKLDGVRVDAICDIDTRLFAGQSKRIENRQGTTPKTFSDIRAMLDDGDVDAISVATCNHWHALATIWACQAGKDVYCEKPACHNVFEGRKMVEAARKYERIVQIGSQGRSSGDMNKAIEMIRAGEIGDVYYSRGLCYKSRWSIGNRPNEETPEGVYFDTWLGPAKKRPFNRNLVHYNWHWFWDFGNGDLGNQGVHQMDIARWALGVELPVKVSSHGGRYGYKDQGETANTQTASFIFEDGRMLVFEVRGMYTNDEGGVRIGNLVYGNKGYLTIYGTGGEFDWYLKEKKQERQSGPGQDHFANFIKAVRSRNYKDLAADVREGVLSADLCHLANISLRLGRSLDFDPKTETFPGDAEANKLLTREYREPYVVPKNV